MEEESSECVYCGRYDSAYDEDSHATHEASTKHRCNVILEQFKTKRKQLMGNRNGVVVVCSTRSSFDTVITNNSSAFISLSARPNEEVKFVFQIMNETRKEKMLVLGIHLAHPQPQFSMSDHGIEFSKEPYAFPPKSKVEKDVIVTFKNGEIGHYEMPVIITVKNVNNGKNTIIIRELIVFVEETKAVHESLTKSPFTRETIYTSKIIPTTMTSKRNDVFTVPTALKNVFGFGLKLKDYTSPEDRSLIMETKSIFDTGATPENYMAYFHNLLWYEETIAKINLKKYNMSKVELEFVSGRFKLLVPGLAEKRPSLMKGDDIFIRLHGLEDFQYGGKICETAENYIIVDGFDPLLCRQWHKEAKFDVRFVLSRIGFERMHQAVQGFSKFKVRVLPNPNKNIPNKIKEIKSFYSSEVASNPEQRTAVEHIVAGTSGSAPYMVYGPPGTGKTVTIVEAILQLVKKNSSNRILVCTDSNMAADHIACGILEHASKIAVPNLLFRVNSQFRAWETMPEKLRQHSNGHSSATCYSVKNTKLAEYRIVVSTLLHVAMYSKKKAQQECNIRMTHVFIDEAAQASEPACLIPVAGLLQSNGYLILAGDPMQLGPVCVSRQAANAGLGVSLMERLKEKCSLLYKTDNNPDPNYITMLRKNFRSHPDILQIPNTLFYDKKLTPHAQPDPLSDIDILSGGTNLSRAIVFHAVMSREQKEGRSPSFFNWKEIEMLKKYVRALIDEHKVSPKDIGVVTPYIRQMYKVRTWLTEQGFNNLEVGTVEAFQGKEKRVIIITTVRANCKLLDHDAKYQLGFLVDDKRFNVALTRAKAKAIVIGNPACLSRDIKWRTYMETCTNLHTYFGRESEQLERTTSMLEDIAITRFDRYGITDELKRELKEMKKEKNKGKAVNNTAA